ncbi:MAG TPA: WD40 repeat domain-containing protein, partial [Roseiflexaceae bacterium]|nr:WD40 repeat domain-containing protein [Roseiflexaceae bacterium]
GSLQASFQGHTNDVTSAVFSPDGASILTASADNTARLWRLDGSLQASLQGHTDKVTSAVFSPDGASILTASADNTARLWRLDGSLQASLQGHTSIVTSAVFSPDGTHILTASWDGTARLWKPDGSLQASFQDHADNGRAVDLHHHEEGSLQASFQGQTDKVNRAVFSPDGTHILTASWDGTAHLWATYQEDWLLAAKCAVNRALTPDEIRDYQVPTPLAFDAAALAHRQCPPTYSWER